MEPTEETSFTPQSIDRAVEPETEQIDVRKKILISVTILILLFGVGFVSLYTLWSSPSPVLNGEGVLDPLSSDVPGDVLDPLSLPTGSSTIVSECDEYEQEVPLPPSFENGKIVFIKDVTYSIGPSINGGGCLAVLGAVEREILPPDSTNQRTIDLLNEQLGVESFNLPPRTKEFEVKNILQVTGRGFSLPSWWLVLSDETGSLYKISVVFFSENGAGLDDQTIAVLQYNEKEYPLTHDNFMRYDTDTGESIFDFQLGSESVDVQTPFLSYEEVVEKIKTDFGVDPIYQGGGKVWFIKPDSANHRECDLLALYEVSTRRYHDTDILGCSAIAVSDTKPLYVEYCAEVDCLFSDRTIEAVHLDTKRTVEIFSLPLSATDETLMSRCYKNQYGGRSCMADVALAGDQRLRIGVYQANKDYSLTEYSNKKIRDEFVDLTEL
jgi:hypothetical protein